MRLRNDTIKCEVCEQKLTELYCTTNVCRRCCEEGLCPHKEWCRAYPEVLAKIQKRRDFNPSRRS